MSRDRSKELGRGEKWQLPAGVQARRVVQDDRLIWREIYNPMPCTLTFKLMPEMISYIHNSGILVGPAIVICKPKDFCIINHAFYICTPSDGRPQVEYITNFGSVMRKGNKGPTPIE